MARLRCPRCRGALGEATVPGFSPVPVSACGLCGGLWASGAAPERLRQELASIDTAASAASAAAAASRPAARARFDTRDPVTCPECRKEMGRFTHEASGCVLDACSDHGVFFDHDELSAVVLASKPRPGPPPIPTGGPRVGTAVAVAAVGAAGAAGLAALAAANAPSAASTTSGAAPGFLAEAGGTVVEGAMEVALAFVGEVLGSIFS